MAAKGPMSEALDWIALLAVGGGLVVTLAAICWWAIFYGGVVGRAAPGDLENALSCLYSSRGVCGFIPGMARAAGRVAYSPALFWLGICSVVGGVATRLLLARPA